MNTKPSTMDYTQYSFYRASKSFIKSILFNNFKSKEQKEELLYKFITITGKPFVMQEMYNYVQRLQKIQKSYSGEDYIDLERFFPGDSVNFENVSKEELDKEMDVFNLSKKFNTGDIVWYSEKKMMVLNYDKNINLFTIGYSNQIYKVKPKEILTEEEHKEKISLRHSPKAPPSTPISSPKHQVKLEKKSENIYNGIVKNQVQTPDHIKLHNDSDEILKLYLSDKNFGQLPKKIESEKCSLVNPFPKAFKTIAAGTISPNPKLNHDCTEKCSHWKKNILETQSQVTLQSENILKNHIISPLSTSKYCSDNIVTSFIYNSKVIVGFFTITSIQNENGQFIYELMESRGDGNAHAYFGVTEANILKCKSISKSITKESFPNPFKPNKELKREDSIPNLEVVGKKIDQEVMDRLDRVLNSFSLPRNVTNPDIRLDPQMVQMEVLPEEFAKDFLSDTSIVPDNVDEEVKVKREVIVDLSTNSINDHASLCLSDEYDIIDESHLLP